jgi:hypothetical protein
MRPYAASTASRRIAVPHIDRAPRRSNASDADWFALAVPAADPHAGYAHRDQR